MRDNVNDYLTLKDLMKRYGLTDRPMRILIKTDPLFPKPDPRKRRPLRWFRTSIEAYDRMVSLGTMPKEKQ